MKFEFDERNEIRLCGVLVCFLVYTDFTGSKAWQVISLCSNLTTDAVRAGAIPHPDLASAQAAGIAIAEAWWARVLAEKDKQDAEDIAEYQALQDSRGTL